MPLNIDVAFKWGSAKKKEDQKTTEATSGTSGTSAVSSSHANCGENCSCDETSGDETSEQQQPAKLPKSEKTQNISTETSGAQDKKSIICVRHAERLDRVFPSWLNLANCHEVYRPFDSNLPRSLPQRQGGLSAFASDPPITTNGQITSGLLGKSIRNIGLGPAVAYCSPSLRCIETARYALRHFGKCKIRIDPGLADWMGWSPDSLPNWMSEDELISGGFRIDTTYKPVFSIRELFSQRKESRSDFVRRIHKTVQSIIKDTESIMIVFHSSTFDAGIRSMLGLSSSIPSLQQLDTLCYRYPYLATVVLTVDGNGTLKEDPKIPKVTSSGIAVKFDSDHLFRK